ncbi:uncharacterized protein SCHCODRAFT_0114273 [Schizophyllum commune H4-8]
MDDGAIPYVGNPEPAFGPWFIVVILSWTLWGVLTLQVVNYYYAYKRDRVLLKWLVAIVWLADTAHKIILLTGDASSRTCTLCFLLLDRSGRYSFSGYLSPVKDVSLISGETAPRVFVTILVQGFCFSRVYIFARRTYSALLSAVVPAVYVLSVLLQLGFTIACLIVTFTADDFADFASKTMSISAPGYLSTALGTDIIMASLMTFFLYQEYRRGHYDGTSSMLRRLCIFSVNTGTWTAVFAIATLILYELRPLDNYWAIFDFGVCGVYSNTLLANLNARNYARGDETVTFTFDKTGSPNKTGSPGRGLPPLSTGDTTTMGYSGYATGETRFTSSGRTDESVTPRDLGTFVTAKEELNSPTSKEGSDDIV